MDWTDLLSQNLETTSPRAEAATDLMRAQTQGAQIANQKSALGLQFEQMLANGMGQGGADRSGVGAPSETPLDLNVSAARQHVFQNYAPLPDVWTPQEQQQRAYAAMSGVPGAVDAVTAMHTQRITSANAARNKAAQAQYNDLYGVATAPDGQAMDMLELVEPQEAARLKAQGLTDDQVRQHAASLAGITHSVSQLPYEYRGDGVAVDKNNGQEIPGYDDAVGVSAKDRADIVKDLHTPVDIPTQSGGTRKGEKWELSGAPNFETAVNSAVRIANIRAPSVANPSAPAAQGAAPQVAPATQGAAPQVAAATPAAAPPQPPVARRPVPPPAVTAAAPRSGSSFGNPLAPSANNGGKPLDFSDIPPGYSTQGRAASTMGPGESATATGASEDLRAANKQAAINVSNANFELTEGKQILNILPAAAVGPGTAAAAKLQTALQGFFGNRTIMQSMLGDPGARQMLEKLLGQDALASTEKEMKESGGGSIRGGAQLMNLAMQKLNASPEMARQAIEAITKYQMQQAAYDRQKWGQDYAAYRVKGGDINSFGTWYDNKYPLQNVVKPISTSNAMPTGARLNAYAAAHFGGDTAKAQAFLTQHGYQ